MSENRKPGLPAAISRRAVLAGGMMIGAAGFAAARQPVPNRPKISKDQFDAMMPKQLGNWKFETVSGLVLPPSDALSDRLYDNLLTRSYTNSQGRVAMFLLAYNNRQDGVLQIHRPEICYPAGGYTLTKTAPVDIQIGGKGILPCSQFSASGYERSEQVLYWTRVGDAFPRSWKEQRLAVFEANMMQIIPDGMLARVSMIDEDMSSALPLMQEFVTEIDRQSPAKLRSLLFDNRG